jgi:energy-coupling factor transport system permease protein
VWLVWLIAAALPALSTRNPLYLSLTLAAVAVNQAALGRNSPLARHWNAFVRFGALLWLLAIPFTALTSHHGAIVLFTLPRHWPVIGGPITLEAFLYGLTGGLALITLLLIFAVFNVAVDQARLLRMTPGFVYQMGVVAGIAVAFVPQMVASWQAIHEAQQVRGHKVRGVRDLLPLLLPLLVTALERAMQLAESMEARGFGGQTVSASPGLRLAHQGALLVGLAAVGAGFAITGFWPAQAPLAGLLIAAGAACLLWSFWDQGRRIRRTRYQRWLWRRMDYVVLAISAAGVIGWAAAWLLRGEWLFYYPYPPYSPWPAFNPVLGVLIALLTAPGMLLHET